MDNLFSEQELAYIAFRNSNDRTFKEKDFWSSIAVAGQVIHPELIRKIIHYQSDNRGNNILHHSTKSFTNGNIDKNSLIDIINLCSLPESMYVMNKFNKTPLSEIFDM